MIIELGTKYVADGNLRTPFKYDMLRPLFPSFLCDNKLNTTERGAADVIFERGTEIITLLVTINW